MTRVLLSTDGPGGERLRAWKFRTYHRVLCVTPSGRRHEAISATLYRGAVWHRVVELTADGSRTLRRLDVPRVHPARGYRAPCICGDDGHANGRCLT